MKIRLDYGKTGLEAELPDANVVAVLSLSTPPPLKSPSDAVAAALKNPIGCAPLSDLARGKRDACIVVCDITRPAPSSLLLPPLLESLARAGMAPGDVTILIATGTHRPNTVDELDAMLGKPVARSCRVINHDCTDCESMSDLGRSPRGVPVRLNRAYVEADLRITVGLIEPHFMAGYSGGRKMVMPGVAALETVQAWHSPRFLEDPRAAAGVVEGNPVHEEALSIARMRPPDLILDVTLNEANRITGVFAGELEAAWREGVRVAGRAARAVIPAPVDIVVTSCAGYPLDLTFYQAVKGMVGALPIVKPGGVIVIASECAEGIGSAHFARTLLETDDLEAFVEAIQREDWRFVPDQWEVEELAKAVRDCEVYCVAGGIPSATLARLFVTPASSVEEAVGRALATRGPGATIAVIPRGPYVIPALLTS